MSSKRKKGRYQGEGYRRARAEALERSQGVCQLCGNAEATTAHHWAPQGEYPEDAEITGDDLTALCIFCHELAHLVRRYSVDRLLDMKGRPVDGPNRHASGAAPEPPQVAA